MLQAYTAFVKYNAVDPYILLENNLHGIREKISYESTFEEKENNYRLLEIKIENICSGFQIFK